MAFSTSEAHGNANYPPSASITTEQVGSQQNPRRLRNMMLWARHRMTLLLFILTIIGLILAHATTPLVIHSQYLYTPVIRSTRHHR